MGSDLWRRIRLSGLLSRTTKAIESRTAPGFTIESRRVVTMGLLPPKIQCSALAATTRAASDKTLENIF